MAKTTIKVDEASAAQLREFASLSLGIETPSNASASKIRGLIAAAWDKETFEIDVPDTVDAFERRAAPDRDAGDGKVAILIQKTEEPGGDRPVFTSVNGKAMLIPRGQVVRVPPSYVEVLKNAVKFVYDQDNEMNMIRREVPSYPYSIVG